MSRVARLVFPGLLLAAGYYAVFGGEYSLFELRRARSDVRTEQDTLAVLEAELDSLMAWADSLRTDSATLERVARERFGMIREGEVLYRFAVPEDAPSPEEEPDT